jgi:O-antigen ligase
MNVTREQLHSLIFRFCCIAMAFFLPIYGRVLPTIIAVMLINWFLEGRFRKIPGIFRRKNPFWIFSFAFIYILYLAGLLYSSNMNYGLFDLQVKLSIIIFPLIFATLDEKFPILNLTADVLKAFVAGCGIATLILFGIAIYSYMGTHDPSVFFYSSLSRLMHVSYLSMYLDMAIAIVAFYLIQKEPALPKKFRIPAGILILYFSIFVFLCSSKAGISSLVMIYLMIFLYLVFVNKQVIRAILLVIIVASIVIGGFKLFPKTADRFKRAEVVLSDDKKPAQKLESNGERLVVWKAGLEVARRHPVFGVGTGDVKDALLDEYQKENNIQVYNLRLNAHNQYLQTYITLGIPGLLSLLCMLLIPCWMTFRRVHSLYFAFLVVFAFNILVESMLEVQAGVVYYAFFNSLFFFALITGYKKNGHTFMHPSSKK